MANEVLAPLLRSETYRRLLFTLGILLAYRLGCQIPLPGINIDVLLRLDGPLTTETVSIFALGVTPFLSALLIFEFIKLIVPPLARWESADPVNARRLGLCFYFLALVMAGLQAAGVANAFYGISGLIDGPGWETIIAIILVAGTMLLGWFGDQITVRGLGNGFWLLLVTPTLVSLPNEALRSVELLQRGAVTPTAFFAAVVFLVAAVALVAATCIGGPRSEYRLSDIDFVRVWPPMFAVYISGFIVTFFSIGAGGAVQPILIAILIAIFSWLQSWGRLKEAWQSTWPIALVQILVCSGGELLTHQLNPPFSVNGSWLIVVVTAAISCLRSKEPTARA
jgi:preprotein translocase subunit SecY